MDYSRLQNRMKIQVQEHICLRCFRDRLKYTMMKSCNTQAGNTVRAVNVA